MSNYNDDDFLDKEDLNNQEPSEEDTINEIDKDKNENLEENDNQNESDSINDIFNITDIEEDEEYQNYDEPEEPLDLEEQLADHNFEEISKTNDNESASSSSNYYENEEQKIEEEFEKSAPFQENPNPTTVLKQKDTRNNILRYIAFSALIIIVLVWAIQAMVKKFVGTPVDNTTQYNTQSSNADNIKFDPFLRKEKGSTEEIVLNNGIELSTAEEMKLQEQEPKKPPVNFAYLRAISKISSSQFSGLDNGASEEAYVNAIDANLAQSENQPSNKNTIQKNRYSGEEFAMATAQKISFDLNLTLQKGTFIPCVMNTRFVSTIAGELSCTITDDVYSANGNVVLMEKGSKVFGQFNTANLEQGEKRMFVIWNEIRTPKNISIKIDSNATGELGESGASIKVDNHYMQRFGIALLVSFISNISNFTTAALADRATKRNNDNENSDSNVRQMSDRQAIDTAAKTTDLITSILEKQKNIAPTGYKNQGEIIGIYVSRDVDFSNIYYLQRKL